MKEPENFNEFMDFLHECRFVTYKIEWSTVDDESFDPDLLYVHKSGKLLYNVDTRNFLHPYLDHKGKGRFRVDLWIGGEWEKALVSRVVADAFMCNTKNKKYVHHIDGNRENNEYLNLIYVTRQEHWALHGLMRNGNDSAYWKLINKLRKDSPFYSNNEWE